MLSSMCLEILGKLFAFASKTGHKTRDLYIYEYESIGKKFGEETQLTTDLPTGRTIRGVFLWKGMDGMVLIVFKNGRVLPVDIRKKEIHDGYNKALKGSFEKITTKNKINIIFALGGKDGIVAGNSEQGIYYYLDFDNALDGLVPQRDRKDSTLCMYLSIKIYFNIFN